MSGTKVVSILSEHNDLFVSGGAIHKLFLGPNSKGHQSEGMEEMVLCAGASYKVLSPFPELGENTATATTSTTTVATPKMSNMSAEQQLLLDDPELALKEAEKRASTKKSTSARAVGGAAVVLWRTPHSHIARICTVSEFYQEAAKDPKLPAPSFISWEAATQNVKPTESATTGGAEGSSSSGVVTPPLPEFGFVMEFITEKSDHKRLEKYHPTFRFQAHRTDQVSPLSCPRLRYRFFSCANLVEQQEWVAMWAAVLTNYWQERLEATMIPEPHVYQFHTWALNKATNTLTQIVLSTTSVFAIPRGSNKAMEQAAVISSTPSAPIATLKLVKVETIRADDGADVAVVKMGSGSSSPALPENGFVFFTCARALELVVELQRVWYMNKGQEEPFPLA